MRIVIIGDSLTFFVPEESRFDTSWIQHNYTFLLKNNFDSTENIEIYNLGDTGRTTYTQSKDERLLYDIRQFKPNVLIVHLGIIDCAPRLFSHSQGLILLMLPTFIRNRIIKFFSKRRFFFTKTFPKRYIEINEFQKNLEKILKEVEHSIIINIVKPSPVLLNRSYDFKKNVVAYNKILSILAKKYDSKLIDLYSLVESDPSLRWKDGYHLSKSGQSKITQELKIEINNFKDLLIEGQPSKKETRIMCIGDFQVLYNLKNDIRYEETFSSLIRQNLKIKEKKYKLYTIGSRTSFIYELANPRFFHYRVKQFEPNIIILYFGSLDCTPKLGSTWEIDNYNFLSKRKKLFSTIFKLRYYLRRKKHQTHLNLKIFSRTYQYLINRIKAINASVIMLNINCPSSKLNESHPHYLKNIIKYNEAIAQVAKNNQYKLVDSFSLTSSDTELIANDGISLSKKGHERISEILISEIEKIS